MMMNNPWWLPGALLIAFGVAIIIFPELLALLVATGMIMAGVSYLLWMNTLRRLRRERRDGTTIYTFERRPF